MSAIIGVINDPHAAAKCLVGGRAMQHRGTVAAGFASTDGVRCYEHRGTGKVKQAFEGVNAGERLPGRIAVGNLRFGNNDEQLDARRRIQPIVADQRLGLMAMVMNGSIPNRAARRASLEERGALFQSDANCELLLHLIANAPGATRHEKIVTALRDLEEAWTLLLMTNSSLFAAVSPLGMRPLVMGRKDGAVYFASESCALTVLGVTDVEHVTPGTLIHVSADGAVRSSRPFAQASASRMCMREPLYFMASTSTERLPGGDVTCATLRKRLGTLLALDEPPGFAPDVVIPVPDSGVPAAIGYAQALERPFDFGIVRSHYNQDRSSPAQTDAERDASLALKLAVDPDIVRGKIVAVVDDLLLEGKTAENVVRMLLEAGAAQVHLRVAAPKVREQCHWGIPSVSPEKLLANRESDEAFCARTGAASLRCLSLEQCRIAFRDRERVRYCDSCFTGEPPVPPSPAAPAAT